ncbi:MAG: TetR family transcriptional regulator [Alphaproteobacteria bacterium]|nr:TetR family transcriptional regulator [Alphaproteobacteria bacterium]
MNIMTNARPERAPTSRDLQREATRGRVLDAARRLFAERGYDETTIRDIAQMAGVAPGSVFTTFESKADLLQEIIYAQYDNLVDDLSGADMPPGDIAARLTGAFAKVYAFESQHLRLLAEIVGASWTWSDTQEMENRRRIGVARAYMDRMLLAAQQSGELRKDADLELISDMIFSCYLRNYRLAIFDGWDAARLSQRLSAQIGLLMDGAKAKRGPRES